MLCRNGLRKGVVGYGNITGAPEARFFSLFYEWSSLGCLSHNYHKNWASSKRSRGNGPTRRLYTTSAPDLNVPDEENRTSIGLGQEEGEELEEGKQPKQSNELKKASDEKTTPVESRKDITGSHLVYPLRQIMRNMPHSVVIVTSSSNNEDTTKRYRGMTVSSFTTLTLTPSPIITFNIKAPSSTLDAIQESRQFLVHLLEANKFGCRIADSFTKGEQEEKFTNGNCNVFLKAGSGPLEPPRLKGYGIMKTIKCKLVDDKPGESGGGLIRVGDHFIVLGKVLQLFHGDAAKRREEDKWNGLGYVHGKYVSLGTEIKTRNMKKRGLDSKTAKKLRRAFSEDSK